MSLGATQASYTQTGTPRQLGAFHGSNMATTLPYTVSQHIPRLSLHLFTLQSEYGDLYKVTVTSDAADKGRVVELKVKYFDTLPACSSICVLRTGFLFAASEFGNHALYQFQVRTVTICANHIILPHDQISTMQSIIGLCSSVHTSTCYAQQLLAVHISYML